MYNGSPLGGTTARRGLLYFKNARFLMSDINPTVISQILQIKDVLPKKQKILCNFICANYNQAATMTVSELAEAAGVGTTTVMRLMQTLQYDSYNIFKRDLISASIILQSATYANMKKSLTSREDASRHILGRISRELAELAAALQTPHNLTHFETTIRLLQQAENIYVVGYRSSYTVGRYFEDTVRLFLPNIRQLATSQEFLFDNLFYMKTTDVLLAFSDWPCTRKTVDFAESCHRKGVPVALVTNSMANPIAKVASSVICTDSLASKTGRLPSFLIAEALVQELGRRASPQSIEALNWLEEMLKETGIVMQE